MIHYFVRYQTFAAPGHTQTDDVEIHETWSSAKQRRNEVFQFRTTRRCWVERIDIRTSIEGWTSELSKKRWGAVLRRDDPETVKCEWCKPSPLFPDQQINLVNALKRSVEIGACSQQ